MRSIKKETLIKTTPKILYEMWTTREGIQSFFGVDANIEMKEEGFFEVYFDLSVPYGGRGSEGCKVIDFKEDSFLSFTWNAPPGVGNHRKNNFHSKVTVYFTKQNDDTLFTLINDGYPDDPMYDDVFQYFEKAWSYVVDHFKKQCK